MSAFDAVVIGSGHNGLVAAAYLARAGWDVCVLERNDAPGGCVATEELTLPGYRHDVMSSWHPLFHLSATYRELGEELARHGLAYRNTDAWTSATATADGRVVVAHRDPAVTAASFSDADGAAYLRQIEEFGSQVDVVGDLLATELHSLRAARLALRLGRRLGRRRALGFTAEMLASSRAWLETTFSGREPADLYAPWVLHTGLDPDAAGGGFLTLAIAAAPHAVGLPVVAGGASGFVQAFRRLIESHGGVVRTGVDVERIIVRGGRAVAVRAGGEEIGARRCVIANTTPTQLYARLLQEGDAPPAAAEQAKRFRYNRRAGMQVHLALQSPLRWRDERLGQTPIVHCSDGPGQVALASAQAAAGLLPAHPTVVVGQPHVLDPSRAPQGAAVLWIQLQEVPYRPAGDAAGELDTADGRWTDALTDAYVERVLDRLRPHVEDLDGLRLATRALSPPDLERRNVNLVRGDIYAGDAALDQSYLWRPLPGYGSHAAPVDGLFHCGASTYPGPGLNAASGRLAAHAALAAGRRPRRRAHLPRTIKRRVAPLLG
jgi:phytoene dehydrogenase-like protein